MILLSDLEEVNNTFSGRKVIEIKPIKNSITVPAHPEEAKVNTEKLVQLTEKRLKEADMEAEKIIRNAHMSIEKEKKEWEEIKKEIEMQAKELGLKQGIELGKKQGYSEYSKQINQAVQVIQQAKKDYQEILIESEDMILHLALTAASKILKVEIIETDHYANLVRCVLRELKDQPKIAVFAHPEDYQLLHTQKDELLNIVQFQADLTLYPDSQLERGACKIESAYGMIDAGLDSQLQELRTKLFELAKEKTIETE